MIPMLDISTLCMQQQTTWNICTLRQVTMLFYLCNVQLVDIFSRPLFCLQNQLLLSSSSNHQPVITIQQQLSLSNSSYHYLTLVITIYYLSLVITLSSMSGGGDMTARSGDCAAVLIPLPSTTRTTPEPRIPGWMGRCRCCSQRHESKYQVPLELGPVWHECHVCCLRNCILVGIGIPEQINQQSLDGHIICLGEEHS